MQLTPPIYARGRYTVRSPFTVKSTVDYTCHAIRSFKDCSNRGIDVFQTVYSANGIDRAKYLEDENLGINIITLIADGESPLYIPDSYIESYPNMGEAVPQRLILSVDLGVISSHWNPQYLMNQISNLASDVVGGTPDVNLHRIPIAGSASGEDVSILESIREIAVKNRTSDHARAQAAERTVDLLTDKVKSLEDKILNRG